MIVSKEEMIRQIIVELTKPGELSTDSESLDAIWGILKENKYDLLKIQNHQRKIFEYKKKARHYDS